MENNNIDITDKEIEECFLFSTCSYLNKDIKTQVLKWYKTLNKEQKDFIDIIIDEQKEEAIYQKNLDDYHERNLND